MKRLGLPGPGAVTEAMHASASTQTITGAGAVTVATRQVNITGGAGFAITLAAPTAAEVGVVKIINLTSISSNAVTMALTQVVGGTAASSASFDTAGEALVLVGSTNAAALKWMVLKEHGVTLS